MQTFGNGNKYVGEFREGKYHGEGKYISHDGVTYEGNWENDQKNGFGVIKFPGGNMYEGYFLNGKFHGKGRYTKNDGSMYDGDWVDQQKTGFGV